MTGGKFIELGLDLAERFVRPGGNPVEQQRDVLKYLLTRARHTEFGRHYNFDSLLQSADLMETFQEVIPYHDYNLLFDRWWHRALAGDPDITWRGKVKYFALSSGTSNATSKRIPITDDMLNKLRLSAFRLFTNLPDFNLPENIYTKSWLGIGGTSRLDKVDGHFEGYLSGINARKRPFWARAFYHPGDKIAAIKDFDMRTEFIAAQAPNWDVGLIIGIPHWVQLTLERIKQKSGINTINEIWPDLGVFVSGGVDFRPYQKIIDELVGHPLVYINTYLASEGMIASQDRPDVQDLQLVLDGGVFFEFIPFNEENFDEEGDLIGSPTAYLLGEVEEGKDYAVIISTCSGAWRYLLGDTVRFTDAENGRIVISGRTKYYLNLCSEHLTGDNMTAAISSTEEALGIIITEFTIAPRRKDNYFEHHWYIGIKENIDREIAKNMIDENLKALNDDYRSERETALSMDLEIVPTSYFYEWQQRYSNAAGQSKVPRVIKGKALETWLQFLKEKSNQ